MTLFSICLGFIGCALFCFYIIVKILHKSWKNRVLWLSLILLDVASMLSCVESIRDNSGYTSFFGATLIGVIVCLLYLAVRIIFKKNRKRLLLLGSICMTFRAIFDLMIFLIVLCGGFPVPN